MPDTTHPCPAKDCPEVVPFELLACKKHWKSLPPQLRAGISREWVAGELEEWKRLRDEAVAILGG